MKRELIGSSPFFDGLSQEEVDALAEVATEREFAEGDTLMTEGDFGYCLYVLRSGSADISRGGETIGTAASGDVVGEIGVLAGRRTATVVATSPVRAVAFFKRDVWKLEDGCPRAAERLRAAMETHIAADTHRATRGT